MKKPDIETAAMEFVRKHKHSMSLNDVKAAMEVGAALMTAALTETIKKTSDQMKKERG